MTVKESEKLRDPEFLPKVQWQELRASAVGQETEVADAHEAFAEQMSQEAPQELVER